MKPLPTKNRALIKIQENQRIVNLEVMQQEIDNPSIKKQFTDDEWLIIDSYMQSGNTVDSLAKINPNLKRNEVKEKALIFFEDEKIKQEIKRRINISIKHNIQLIDSIIREYSTIAFANLDDFVTWDDFIVTLIPSNELTKQQKAGIAEVSQTKHGVKIKLHPKLPALDSLAKVLNLLKESINLDLTNSDGSLSPKERSVVVLPDNHRGGLIEN